MQLFEIKANTFGFNSFHWCSYWAIAVAKSMEELLSECIMAVLIYTIIRRHDISLTRLFLYNMFLTDFPSLPPYTTCLIYISIHVVQFFSIIFYLVSLLQCLVKYMHYCIKHFSIINCFIIWKEAQIPMGLITL